MSRCVGLTLTARPCSPSPETSRTLDVTGSNSRVWRNTHTRWCRKQASSLALSGAPVCGFIKLPEGGRRDTGGGRVNPNA